MRLYGSVRDPDTFFRKTGNAIAGWLQYTEITANQVSIFRILLLIPVFICYVTATPWLIFFGATIYQIFTLLDFVDGALARLKKQESKLGIFIEEILDPILAGSGGMFGLAVSLGVYNMTENYLIFVIVLLNTISLYHKKHNSIVQHLFMQGKSGEVKDNSPQSGFRGAIFNYFLISLWWNEQYIIWASWLYIPLSYLPINPLFLGFGFTATSTMAAYLFSTYKIYKMAKCI